MTDITQTKISGMGDPLTREIPAVTAPGGENINGVPKRKPKKEKKPLTADEQRQKDFDKDVLKFLASNGTLYLECGVINHIVRNIR